MSEVRQKIFQALEEHLPTEDGGFPTNFFVVAEYINSEGKRVLAALSSNADGEELPPWQVRGYLDHSLKRFL